MFECDVCNRKITGRVINFTEYDTIQCEECVYEGHLNGFPEADEEYERNEF